MSSGLLPKGDPALSSTDAHILRLIAAGLSCLALLVISACAPAPPFTFGNKIQEPDYDTIVPGKTTRADVLKIFGMPMAIAERDEALNLRSGSIWLNTGVVHGAPYIQRADSFFELFRDNNEIKDHHRIYYYYYTYSYKTGIVALFYVHEKERLSQRHLWLLVNERTGIVEDAFFQYKDSPGRRPLGVPKKEGSLRH